MLSGEVGIVVTRNGWARQVRLRPSQSPRDFGLTAVARPGGAEIVTVMPNSPGAAVGLQPGDVITVAGGRPVDASTDLMRLLRDYAARGASLDVLVKRAEWSKTMTLTPGPPASVATASRQTTSPPGSAPTPAPSTSPLPQPSSDRSPAVAIAPPDDATSDVRAGNRAYDQGNWRDAETYYRRVVEADPHVANAWTRLCHAQVMLAKFVEAARTCQSATQYAAGEATVYQNLGLTLFRLGKPAESITFYRRAIELSPGWALPYSGAGAAYYAMGDWTRTEEFYRLAVARDPRDGASFQALGDASAELGKHADAITYYRRALELQPGSAEVNRLLGWQYLQLLELGEAERAFREANRLDPKNANVLLNLGVVLDRQNKRTEAREAWQRASDLDLGKIGAMARENLINLDARQADVRAQPQPLVAPSPPSRTAATVDSSRNPVDEPRALVEPEADAGN